MVENIGNHLVNASEFLQKRAVHNFSQADPDYGRGIQQVLDRENAKKKSKQVNLLISFQDCKILQNNYKQEIYVWFFYSNNESNAYFCEKKLTA